MRWLQDRQESLRGCYDEQAAHFVQTRKRPRPEFSYIQQAMQTYLVDKTASRLVELGCGGGRLYNALEAILPPQTTYIGVDFAQGMITQAKKAVPQATRLVDDMVTYLIDQPQESIDVLLGIASIQHIKGSKQRTLFFADAYKALTRGGMLILTNRSYSDRFLHRYWPQMLKTFPQKLRDSELVWNDVIIPRKDHKTPTHQHGRYYHMFTLYELEKLATQAGFVIRTCAYVAQDGTLTSDRRQARNSLLIVQKDIG